MARHAIREKPLAELSPQRVVRSSGQTRDVVRELFDFDVRDRSSECGHRAASPFGDARQDRVAVAAIERIAVGEIGRTQRAVAAGVAAMARGTVLDEHWL